LATHSAGKYAVVEVDEDYVRMSTFVEAKLNCQFEDGKAFYEATEDEEDFLYYKKILRPEEEKVIILLKLVSEMHGTSDFILNQFSRPFLYDIPKVVPMING
jgi:hypothetical protein